MPVVIYIVDSRDELLCLALLIKVFMTDFTQTESLFVFFPQWSSKQNAALLNHFKFLRIVKDSDYLAIRGQNHGAVAMDTNSTYNTTQMLGQLISLLLVYEPVIHRHHPVKN